ncbi:MAG: ABC-2 family transporter protein [Verrucomicrobia subdivision 3 bacterium]|nr:ABC-2 family transporter protein [Limisphaerales bacterium]
MELAEQTSRPRGLRRYARIYAELWKNSVVREMGFKSNFLLWIVVELLWFALHIAFITVIYQHTNRIGDWSKWQVVLLMGAAHFIQQIFQAFFLTNCVQISEYIRTGKLDFMLLLPVNARFIVSLRQVDLGGFVNAASAVAVIAYSLRQLGYPPSPTQIAGFLGLVVAGALIHYALMFTLASISFWTVRAQGIVWGYYSLFNIARLPDAAFRGFFKLFFTFALPMLLVVNVPAKVLLNKLSSPGDIALLLALGFGCVLVSEAVWRFSLKHYTSASS